MKFNNIKLFVFDLDDTLYDETEFVIGGFRCVADALAPDNSTLSENLFQQMKQLYLQKRRDIFQVILGELGLFPDEQKVRELINIYRTADRSLTLFADAKRLISNIKRKGKQIAILTDGFFEAQQTKIKLLQLDSIVDKIIYTDELGKEFWKPSTKGFEILEQEFGTYSSENIYIADNEEKDFFAPNVLGWITVKVKRPNGIHFHKVAPNPEYFPTHFVDRLDEIML